ncbi:MAG: peptide-methionine (R)-S-oxide reductase MsrB, partial [Bacteroidia bacterium]
PFTGKYTLHKEKGIYICGGCGQQLFDSNKKFDSGCGWPSFNDVIDNQNIIAQKDTSHGMLRIEILCSACGGHLGHVFDDGPQPTGLRYCINSIAIDFEAQKQNQ